MAIQPIFRKAVQTQIDWPLVGVDGLMRLRIAELDEQW